MTAAPSSESGTVVARASTRAAKTPLDLNETVEATVASARTEWQSYSDFELALDIGLPRVPAVATSIERAISALIDHAAQAIKDVLGESGTKGTIAISTSQRGDLAQIKVTDNGPGIPDHAAAQILGATFDGVTQSTLADCRAAIVDQHGGGLEFETEPGVGTTFTVSLPLDIEEESA